MELQNAQSLDELRRIRKPLLLDELRKISKPVCNVNLELKRELSAVDKVAIRITESVGSMGFFAVIFCWTALWLLWNTLAPVAWRFDTYPSFVLWLFISNMIQLFLLPLIMVGQNLQGEHAEARAEADFEVNTKAEIEIENILLHLENQNTLILQILNRLENKPT